MEFKSYKPVEKKELKIDIQQDDKIKKRSDKKEINMTVVELKQLCKEKCIRGYSKLKKKELIELLNL